MGAVCKAYNFDALRQLSMGLLVESTGNSLGFLPIPRKLDKVFAHREDDVKPLFKERKMNIQWWTYLAKKSIDLEIS